MSRPKLHFVFVFANHKDRPEVNNVFSSAGLDSAALLCSGEKVVASGNSCSVLKDKATLILSTG
jgi:hypothetical protein